MRQCPKCKKEKEVDDFYKNPDGFPVGYCIPCQKVKSAEYRSRRKKRMRFLGDKMYDGTMKTCKYGHQYPRTKENWIRNVNSPDWLDAGCKHCAHREQLKSYYGIDQPDKVALHKYQGGVCAICKRKITTNGDANVDHDHSVGVVRGKTRIGIPLEQRRRSVRGLLCSGCNKIFHHLSENGLDPETWARNVVEYERNPPAPHVLFPDE